MSGYIGIGSQSKSASGLYIGINNTAKQVQKAYIGVDGKARLWYQRGARADSLGIGVTIKLGRTDGSYRDWLVVQQGNPNGSIYDTSCNGTWLMQNFIYENTSYSGLGYPTSNVANVLNSVWNNLTEYTRSFIKTVKIPYLARYDDFRTLGNGYSCNLFIPSANELNKSSRSSYDRTTALTYFKSNSAVAYTPGYGDTNSYWTRTYTSSDVALLRYTGNLEMWNNYWQQFGIRVFCILRPDALISSEGYIVGYN